MKLIAAVLLLALSARAEHTRDEGVSDSGIVSKAEEDMIFSAVPARGGINGQIVVRRLSADGGVFWEQRWGRGRGEEAAEIAVMHDGGVTVAGIFQGGCFATRFDAQGRVLWEAAPVSRGQCHPAGLVSDEEGAVYLLAAIAGQSDFDAMVWKLSARGGDALWSYRYSSHGPVYPQDLYLDPLGTRLRAFFLRKNGTEFEEDLFLLDLDGRRL